MTTPEINAKIALLRQKALTNEMTPEDMAEAVKILRAGRVSAHVASDASRRKKAAVEVPSADQFLADLGL